MISMNFIIIPIIILIGVIIIISIIPNKKKIKINNDKLGLLANEGKEVLEEVLEDKYECPNCDKECFESELIEDDYAEHKGFSEELFCPSCNTIVE